MIALPNSHLVLHKETLKQLLKNKKSTKHFILKIKLGPCKTEWVKNQLQGCIGAKVIPNSNKEKSQLGDKVKSNFKQRKVQITDFFMTKLSKNIF